MCDQYLITYHRNELHDIVKNEDDTQHFSININFIVLFDSDPSLGDSVLKHADNTLKELDEGAQQAQTILIEELMVNGVKATLKKNVHCRVYGLPICPELHRNLLPKNYDANKFLQISGTVVRISVSKLLEFKREYVCTKCKYKTICYAEYESRNIISVPRKCSNPVDDCSSTNLICTNELQSEFCKDYQEIKIQEQVSQLGFGMMPNSMWASLEDDLVDFCKPGDNITICGIVKRRWSPFIVGKKIDIELVIKANHIQINNTCGLPNVVTPEVKELFKKFWETHRNAPVIGRDIILKSFCPQIFGLHIVKLAVAVVLAGGCPPNQDSSTGVRTRSESHLLLVGDPGTGKSQLLRFASEVVPRSVLTTGVGSTAAGLTVAAIMEDGEWQLEGGALVLADGGVCCIDEFNSMKEHDRTSIHEAMEQQTISVAKATIVCKLSTRCSILAATNPKGNIDPFQPLCMNLALASPLLSRFDLILLIRDTVQEDWDTLVADYILNDTKDVDSKFTKTEEWNLEMLQAYFTIIKKINPTLTEEANRILSSYYQLQRRQDSRNKSRTTVRLLDSLIRLSQGHARLLFHETVQVVDAVSAVVLVEIGMGYQEDSVLNLNINVHSSFPDNSMDDYLKLLRNVLDKLNLQDILEAEIGLLQSEIEAMGNRVRMESKYFNNRQNKDEVNSSEDTTANIVIERNENKTKIDVDMEKSIFQDENTIDDIDLNL